jgi:hypothetical protein
MYQLTEDQVSFISNDIRERGIRLDDLHNNLLDHICCVIENDFDGQSDFQIYYETLIQRFYAVELNELEEETLLLLTFKNQEKMKKMTQLSGVFAATTLCAGLFFKYMHWPGAAALIFLGIASAAIFFLPLQFILRSRKTTELRETLSAGFGTVFAILLSLHILFKVFHWPGAALFFYLCLSLAVLFIFIYFFGGINKANLRERTILNSILMVLAIGLVLTLMRTPRASYLLTQYQDAFYAQSEKLDKPSHLLPSDSSGHALNSACENLKTSLLMAQPRELVNGASYRMDAGLRSLMQDVPELEDRITILSQQLTLYTASHPKTIPAHYTAEEIIKMMKEGSIFSALAFVTQLQLAIYQNPA